MAFLNREMLSKVKQNTVVTDHPLIRENIAASVRQAYLQGCVLATLMECDAISQKAREKLIALGKSLHIEDESIKDAISLVTGLAETDKEQFVSELLEAVKGKPVAQWFLLDFEKMMCVDKTISKDSYDWLNHFGFILCNGSGWRSDTMVVCKSERESWMSLCKAAASAGDYEGVVVLGLAELSEAEDDAAVDRGLKLIRQAASVNNICARFLLGQYYEMGLWGFECDGRKAYENFLFVANSGDNDGEYKVGDCLYNGLGVAQDYSKAFEWYMRAAEKGNAGAQCMVGICYLKGNGVGVDREESVKWMLKSAEKGDDSAQNNMADFYEQGTGVEQDIGLSLEWRNKAAESGNTDAQLKLGYAYLAGDQVEEDACKAFNYFKMAAELENAEAQNMVAMCYSKGDGVPESQEEHFKWVVRAANNGDMNAMNNLAIAYECGLGCEMNEHEAAHWRRRAAEAGHADAQNALGIRYLNGDCVERDESLAFEWCSKAAEQDLATAQFNMGTFYENGQGCVADMDEALHWYRKAAAQDEPNALTRLGCYAVDSEGDMRKAKRYLKKAADLGDESAAERLSEMS